MKIDINRVLSENMKEKFRQYVEEVVRPEFLETTEYSYIDEYLKRKSLEVSEKLTEEEKRDIRFFTGYSFRSINALLRDSWSYEVSGRLTLEEKRKNEEMIHSIDGVMQKMPSLELPFVTYRGVKIDAFSVYSVKKLKDLYHLKGKYLYEQSFISTSLKREESYFLKDIENNGFCNIMLQYFIPAFSNDGLLLSTSDITYSKLQNEFLLNRNALFFVSDVVVSDNSAIIQAVLIPRFIREKVEKEEFESSKKKAH